MCFSMAQYSSSVGSLNALPVCFVSHLQQANASKQLTSTGQSHGIVSVSDRVKRRVKTAQLRGTALSDLFTQNLGNILREREAQSQPSCDHRSFLEQPLSSTNLKKLALLISLSLALKASVVAW
ncbi:hypothetical protein FGO68_gene3057 [Halteria grandinella]|uniref:Uncharacterized protein n=1 Tax=Halteria grandinella TaxID=5974 RepID=A0A8J8NG89_HALGN|nr:hypothetical protein FGO68_gene3057 [Halteria grandinella]